MTSPTRQAAIEALDALYPFNPNGGDADPARPWTRAKAEAFIDALTAHFLSEAEGANACTKAHVRCSACGLDIDAADMANWPGKHPCAQPAAETPASLKDSSSAKSDEEQMPDLFVADLSGPDDAYRHWTVRESLDDFSDWARSEAVRYVPAAGRNVSAKGDEELGRIAYEAYYEEMWNERTDPDAELTDWHRVASAVRAAVEEGRRMKLPSQDAIDAGARHMAEEIVANQKLTTLDDARRFARNWIETAAQHARNEEYFRSERDAALARVEAALSVAADAEDRMRKMADRADQAERQRDGARLVLKVIRDDLGCAEHEDIAEGVARLIQRADQAEARVRELEAELAEARVATEARLEMRQQIASAEMRERAAKVCEEYATERVKLKSPAAAGIVMGAKECAARVRELPLTAPPAPAAEKRVCIRCAGTGGYCVACWEASGGNASPGHSTDAIGESDRNARCPDCNPNSPPARGER